MSSQESLMGSNYRVLNEWNNKIFQMSLSRKRQQIGREMQNSTDPEITAWILRAMVKEGQKRDSKQRKKKKERKKNIKLIICTNFFYT